MTRKLDPVTEIFECEDCGHVWIPRKDYKGDRPNSCANKPQCRSREIKRIEFLRADEVIRIIDSWVEDIINKDGGIKTDDILKLRSQFKSKSIDKDSTTGDR